MSKLLWVVAAWPAFLQAADGAAAALAAQIREAGLDSSECYRVREVSFSKQDIRFYLTDGHVIFGKPVRGRRISAVFSGQFEGGDGELLVMPPARSERLSLATFTNSPNLNEHFRLAVMLFTDDTAEELAGKIRSQSRAEKSPEMGLLLEQQFAAAVSNLSASFGIRLVYDLLSDSPLEEGFFYAAVRGNRLGNFDVIHDPVADEQIQVGQVQFRDGRSFFDIWTSFRSRSSRSAGPKQEGFASPLTNYVIEATLDSNLNLKALTRASIRATGRPHRVVFFEISDAMKVSEVRLDGEACEVWQREALRDNLLRGRGNNLFLIVAPQPIEPDREYRLEVWHEGQVIADAGNGVYFVGSRGSWYPRQGLNFTHYDIAFRYPSALDLVFTGTILENRKEGEWRITRRKTESPIRLAGFNVGEYKSLNTERAGYRIELHANRRVEKALEPQARVLVVPPSDPPWQRRNRPGPEALAIPAPAVKPDPTARLKSLADEISQTFEFMASHFGPPPSQTLTVSPIPGAFGQGFPGLLYLSTVAYLDPKERPKAARDEYHEYFFSEILHAHETAHQWWGNVVTASSYQDEWLMEALANYSALLMLERNRGPDALRDVLNRYRANLLAKNDKGQTLESAGPISWGPRLDSSQARAWRTITYEKGSWIIHMLRRKMGDQRFLGMLGELCRRYRYRSISMEDFRLLAAEYLPAGAPDPKLESFYDNWVYDVGVPRFKWTHAVKGAPPKVRISGTVTQSDVAEDFGVFVPIEIRFAGAPPVIHWIHTSSEPVPFEFIAPQRPSEVVLNPSGSVLAMER